MQELTQREFKVFDIFKNKWALLSAKNGESFNGCTIGWGSLGTLWNRKDSDGQIATVFVHPSRYTLEFLKNSDTFTISFFPEDYKKALAYMGSKSGKDEDKIANAGLSLEKADGEFIYKEANLTLICKKLYAHQLSKDDIAPEIVQYYKSNPKVYPPDENGEWQPHYIFIGEIIKVIEK